MSAGPLPEGWGRLELAEDRARQALASWDSHTAALYLDRATVLAEAVRALLTELEADRSFRKASNV